MKTNLTRAFTTLVLVSLAFSASFAQQANPNWIRYPAISPDGQQVAFSFQGDIWIADVATGASRLLTTHAGYERSPVWSPDGQSIAFMADWHGNGDVFLVPSAGGHPARLTYHSATDVPTDFTVDGEHVVFTSARQAAHDALVGLRGMGELYSVPVTGGRPRQLMTTDAHRANFDPTGKRLVFHDYKGFEDNWRKHHTSSVTRDIWTYELESESYTRLSGFAGEDRSPVFGPEGKTVYYLSEQRESQAVGEAGKNLPDNSDAPSNGVIPQLQSSFNVWMLNLDDPSSQQQVTSHDTHPVRFLTISETGTLCYSFNGGVWIKPADGEAKQLSIQVGSQFRDNSLERQTLRSGATEFAVSPNEEEIAFVVRGEVYVANVEFGTTRRITATPAQERSVTWGKDNRTLYYAGERDNSWNLYRSKLARDGETGFANATLITEEPVLVSDDETFQPLASPDGKKLAYLRNRTELMVLDLDTLKSSTLVPAKLNFSYSDGDIQYRWSPDSRWIVLTYAGHKSWTSEIGAVNLASGEITNLTESGYGEGGPLFTSNRAAILYSSDRYGERSHASWGGESDVIAVYLNQDAYDEATLSKEELALKKKQEEQSKNAADKAGEEKTDAQPAEPAKTQADEAEEPLDFDTEDLDPRRRRLTLHSSDLASYDLSPDGEQLLYIARVDDKWGLWLTEVRDRSTSHILSLSGSGSVQYAQDGKSAFVMQGDGQISKVTLAGSGKASAKPVSYAAEIEIDGHGERAYIFEHAWRQVQRKFYDENLHGVDWPAMRENYAQFLPSINNNYDFAELLGEMLGELNASHTGCRYRPSSRDGDQTAALGLIYDLDHDGVGLKVAEVLQRGPCDSADSRIEAGAVITHFNGVRLTSDINPWELLNRQSGKALRLAIVNPAGEEWEEIVRPASRGAVGGWMYERWIRHRRQMCEQWSSGRIGYVHVQGMNDASFRRVYSETLGLNNEKEALIVDTRFNGGGWLHEDLATFLSGQAYCEFAPRGHKDGGLGGEPINKWTRPVVVLQSESNYSDAHFFPWAFREKGVGKLIGAPVPGTATAVWWENQINPAIVFGIPQVGMVTRDGQYLENNQLEPDVLILNDPPAMAAGQDLQLKRAVEELLKDLEQ